MLMLFIMGAILRGSDTQASGLPATVPPALPTSTNTAVALASLTPTATLPATNTPLPSPTYYTATATDTATATATASPTLPPPTETASPTASATAVPHTPTPFPTPTFTPLPLPTPHDVYSWTLKVPILMYHYISEPPEDADKYRLDLSVSPQAFQQQMAFLAANGFNSINFEDLSRAIADKQELPLNPVIITIDDGYRDNYTNAFPILQEYGLTATIFLVTDMLDRGHPDYLTWDMVKEMAAAGIQFGPHTKSHPDLRGESRETIIWQILGSRETVAAHVGYLSRYFAYPSGRYDEDTISVLKELDFWGAVTTLGGKWHSFEDRYEWTRMRVRNSTTLPEFADLVDPGGTVGGKLVGR